MAENLGFGGNPFLGQNPYLQQNIDATLGDITRNYNLAVKPNTESAMVRSGSFGNSGLQQMQGEQQRNLAQTMGNTAGAMRMQDYGQQQQMYQWDQGFNAANYNNTFNQNQTLFQNAQALMGNTANMNQQDVTNSTAIQNTPLNYYNQFAGIANQFGNAGGAQSQNAQGSPLMGALGGWQLGGAIGNNLGFGGGNGNGNGGYSLNGQTYNNPSAYSVPLNLSMNGTGFGA